MSTCNNSDHHLLLKTSTLSGSMCSRRRTIDGYFCFDLIARGYDLNPQWAFNRWLSEPTTLEFILLWEKFHNPLFDNNAYVDICHNALTRGTCPTLQELKNKARISSIYFDLDFVDEIYLHRDIACDFAAWASPAFRTYCLHNLSADTKTSIKFLSEEDFVVSSISVAKSLAKDALDEYVKSNDFQSIDEDLSVYDYYANPSGITC